MAQTDDLRVMSWEPDRLCTALFTVFVLVLLYARFSGPQIADWDGYSSLWDQGGGWLRRQGRDPLFVALIEFGRAVLGGNGYPAFRAVVFAVFVAAAGRVAFALAPGRTWSIFLATIVVSAFLIKSLAQIREGLAFLLVLWPLVSTYRWGRSNLLLTGVFMACAPLMHTGVLLYTGLWLTSAALCFMPRVLVWRGLPSLMIVLGVAAGAAVVTMVSASASALEFSLRDLGIDTTVEAIGGVAKEAYWLANGAAVLVLGRQLVAAGQGSGRFGQAWALGLGSFVLPLIYTVCVILVFRQFLLPAITSMAVRLLFSSMQLGLLIVALRGKANLWSIGIASALILDQVRLLFDVPLF